MVLLRGFSPRARYDAHVRCCKVKPITSGHSMTIAIGWKKRRMI